MNKSLNKPLFTIIMVCYNAEDVIGKSLESVRSQTFKDYEVIIKDGNSSDNTLKIVEKYKKYIDNIKLFSEPDNGIYDAMNYAIDKAGGKYIYFLNAGDVFYQNTTLEIVSRATGSNKNIYYGNTKCGVNIEKYPAVIRRNWLILHEKMICHQALFAERTTFNNNLFDTNYKLIADRKWLIRALDNKATYSYLKDVIVVDYDTNGVSSIVSNFQTESIRLGEEYYGRIGKLILFIKHLVGRKG